MFVCEHSEAFETSKQGSGNILCGFNVMKQKDFEKTKKEILDHVFRCK